MRMPGLLRSSPSVLDRVMSQLKKAEKDQAIAAVILKINSPGGSVTASDILYHELQAFKKRSDKKILVQMMDVAASGGVYIALAADHIQAHPSTMTGSVGVITLNADLSGTLEKIGAKVNVYKTGENKDMGSPFRAPSETDKQAFQSMIDDMAQRFFDLVESQRSLDETLMREIKTARIYSGAKAKEVGLVDSLGYLSDATKKACQLAGEKDCKVVTYRYQSNANATAYSPSMLAGQTQNLVKLIDLPMMQKLSLPSGMYYLYLE